MEKNQETMKKKNMSIKIATSGSGGLAGIILLGGALATAALVSTFAFKTKKQKFNKSSKVVKEDADKFLVDEGLSFLVSDSLSPQLDHHSSNGTQSKLVSTETMILDDTRQVNGEKDEEIDILKKAREGLLCEESVTGMEEIPVLVADGSSLLKPDEMKINDLFEENAVLEVDEKIMMADSYQVGDVDDCQHIPLKEDEVGVDGKEHMPAEKCKVTREVILEREEVLVEVPRSEQLEIDYDYHKLGDECDGNGQILVEIREGLVKAAAVDKIRADDNPYMGGEESDNDAGITIEKGEEIVGDAANRIHMSEQLESTTMYGDQDILCSDGTIIYRHENGICEVKKTDLLLPIIDSSSLLKPADHDHVENQLVIEDTKILEGDEANETEDSIKVEERGQTHLVKANDDNKIYIEITNDKLEDPDEIGVENDQQMQCEEYQKNHNNEDQKYSSNKSSPEINSFQCNGCEEQEFSFPLLDSPPYFNFGNLIKNDSSETALRMENVNPMEKDDRAANEVFAYQIILENKSLVQSAKNDEMKSCDDVSENDAVEGEETLETGLLDIGQQTEFSEQYNFLDGRKNDEEALEMIQTENAELENQQSPLKEDSYHGDNLNREEDSNDDSADEDAEENSVSDEEDSVDGSSETTGDSSPDSNAEVIWPVESVQEFSEKVKDRVHANNHNHNYMETERGDSNVNFKRRKLEEEGKDNFDMDFSNKLTAEITTLRQPTNFFNLKFWFLSLLVPFLLVLWLLSSHISFPGLSSSHLH